MCGSAELRGNELVASLDDPIMRAARSTKPRQRVVVVRTKSSGGLELSCNNTGARPRPPLESMKSSAEVWRLR